MRPLILALLVAASFSARARAQSSDGGKVYVGPEGVTVAVVFLHPRGDNKALVEVSGSASEIDGKARLHQVVSAGTLTELRGKLHGRDFDTLVSGAGHWTLYVPGGREVTITYDDVRSKTLDAAAVIARHQQQQKDGSLTKLEAFDRGPRMSRAEASLKEEASAVNQACGGKLAVSVDWSSISDETLGDLSIPSYCGAPLQVMAKLCKLAAVARAQLAPVSAFACKLGASEGLEQSAARLQWTFARDSSNLEEHLTTTLLGAEASGAAPWGKLESLGQRIALEEAIVCSDGKSHVVVVATSRDNQEQLFYGDGKRLARVTPLPMMSGTDFFDPRHINPTANPDFRGQDMRLASSVSARREDKSCAVRCGTRTIPLPILPAATANPLLSAAEVAPAVEHPRPHALLRDEHGSYYYVDKGAGNERKFRLFKGQKGALKEQKMTNVVSDSEGEIFSTRTGSLRMIIDRRKPSVWIERGKTLALRAIPVEENLPLIYNDLGVYAGERLGTPCDDL